MIIHNKKARDSVEFTIFKLDQPIPEKLQTFCNIYISSHPRCYSLLPLDFSVKSTF